MDLTALLLKLYFNVESAYYEFLDAIDNYAPVYKVLVNPIEDAGYPSFPVYCVLLAAVLAVLFFFSFAGAGATSSLYLQVVDSQGAPLAGAVASVFTTGGNEVQVAAGSSDFSGQVGFVGIPVKPLKVQVSKPGYEAAIVQLGQFPLSRVNVSLVANAGTAMQIQRQQQAQDGVNREIERLKRDGYPEFAEAVQQASEVLKQISVR